MIHQIFSILDSKAEAFITPFFLPNKEMAIREITSCANDEKHKFGEHPDDFTLFHIGEFNNITGIITLMETKVSLGNCLQFVIPKKDNQQIIDELEMLSEKSIQHIQTLEKQITETEKLTDATIKQNTQLRNEIKLLSQKECEL